MTLFAYRKSWSHRALFSGGNELKEFTDLGIIDAESYEDARDKVISGSSVLSLGSGVTLELVPVSLTKAHVFHAQYADGMGIDDSHRSTGAPLVKKRVR